MSALQHKDIRPVSIVLCILMGVILGVIIGVTLADSYWTRRLTKAGVAEYQVDKMTGETHFIILIK